MVNSTSITALKTRFLSSVIISLGVISSEYGKTVNLRIVTIDNLDLNISTGLKIVLIINFELKYLDYFIHWQ